MKKFCSFLFLFLAMISISSTGKAQSDGSDLVTTVIIMHDIPASQKPRLPEKDPLAFYCCVVAPTNSLLLSSNKSVLAEVQIDNLTTGDTVDYSAQVTLSPSSFSISGSGEYHVTITLSDGNTYYGDFEI